MRVESAVRLDRAAVIARRDDLPAFPKIVGAILAALDDPAGRPTRSPLFTPRRRIP